MSALPNGWVEATLSDVTTPRGEKADPSTLGEMPFLGMDHIEAHTAKLLGSQPVSELKSAVAVFKKGDLLYGRLRPYLNKVHLAEFDGAASAEFIVFPPSEVIEQRFLQSLLRSPAYRTIADQRSTGDRPRVKFGKVSDFSFALPPIPEQRRIVRKLDTLSARTTTARTHLTAVAKLVERYRQQVFEIAFAGGLTEDLRGEREGQSTRDTMLPSGWKSLTLGEISEIQGDIQVGKKRPSEVELVEVPYLRVANVQRGWLNLDEIKTISVTPQEKERLLLQDGDILMNEGGDRDKLGRGWIWRAEVAECIHQNHVFRIRLFDTAFPSEFVSHYANAMGQRYFFDEGKQTTNLASISKSKVSSLPIPVPPTSEAMEIVRRIDATFAKVDRLAAEAEKVLKMTDRLDQRILAKAFAGELVPQDPDDESANKLLARIREARAKTPATKRRRGPKKKKEVELMQRKIEEVLTDAGDWLPSQEVFRRCGIADGAETNAIEVLYAELRSLEKAGRLEIEPVADTQGRKLHDRLKIKAT